MSVILGKFNFISGLPINPKTLNKMLQKLNLWEADNIGSWQNKAIALGNRTIYNTIESIGEKLPYVDKNSGNVVTADVRLDNRNALFNHLLIPIGQQATITDSVLLLKAYQKWGKECTKYLLGAFAFAIWDNQKKQLFCARDHIGIKPFFYFSNHQYFAFCSEAQLFSVFQDFPLKVSGTHIVDILSQLNDSYITFFEEIKILPPAHSIIVNAKGVNKEQYWQLNPNKQIKLSSDAEYTEQFKSLLEEAINCRMRSNYAIGCQLSGGLDSGGIAAIGNKIANKAKQQFYTYSNEMPIKHRHNYIPYNDESKLIDELINYAGIKNYRKITFCRIGFSQEIDNALKLQGFPAHIMFYFAERINSFAKEDGIRTMLSGFLGDQMVTARCSGYLNHYFEKLKWFDLWKECKVSNRPLRRLLGVGRRSITSHLVNYRSISSSWKNKLKNQTILNPKFHKKWESYFYKNKIIPRNRIGFDTQTLINNIAYPNIEKRIQAETLSASSHKIENRYPLSDIRLIEFFLATPLNQKVHLGVTRHLYRRAMEGILPKSIQYMNKSDSTAGVIPYMHMQRYKEFGKIEQLLLNCKNDSRFEFLNIDLLLTSWYNMRTMIKTGKDLPVKSGKVLAGLQLIKLIEKNPKLALLINAAFQ